MAISDEAVEAATDAQLDHLAKVGNWEATESMRAALEAAAPFIRAEALEEAAAGWSDWDALEAPEDWLRARAAEMRQP